MAGHVLGLHPKMPYQQLDLTKDLAKAMVYIRSKGLSDVWTNNGTHALRRFRHFLAQERGEVCLELPQPIDVSRYLAGLPAWLATHLQHLCTLRQAWWRASRVVELTKGFWHQHTRLWRWLFAEFGGEIQLVKDVKRRHLYAYMDAQLAEGYAVRSLNTDLRAFQATLQFIQTQGELVPQAIVGLAGLKEPASLPRFLTAGEMATLQTGIEEAVASAQTEIARRDALLNRAAFYLLWQGGLRVGEVEELALADLQLAARKLIVRQGKGRQDRLVYLTDKVCLAVEAYLAVRGETTSDHLFIYRFRPLRKDIVRDRLRALGERVGVKVTPHMLRHTFATQLLNADCPVTTIQMLLGHQRLQSTLVYARLHDPTLAGHFYTAMAQIEQGLSLPMSDSQEKEQTQPDVAELLAQLQVCKLNSEQAELVAALQRTLLG
jgi:site-specific recombinase XerD